MAVRRRVSCGYAGEWGGSDQAVVAFALALPFGLFEWVCSLGVGLGLGPPRCLAFSGICLRILHRTLAMFSSSLIFLKTII